MSEDASCQELGVAQAYVLAGVTRMSEGDGLRRQSMSNGVELRERGIGAFAAALIIASLVAFATDYSYFAIDICIAIALIPGGIWLLRRANINRIRDKQVRDLTVDKNQDIPNA